MGRGSAADEPDHGHADSCTEDSAAQEKRTVLKKQSVSPVTEAAGVSCRARQSVLMHLPVFQFIDTFRRRNRLGGGPFFLRQQS